MNEDGKEMLTRFIEARSPDEASQAAAWDAITQRIGSGDMGPPLPEDPPTGSGAGALAAKIGIGVALLAALVYLRRPHAPNPATTAQHQGTTADGPGLAEESGEAVGSNEGRELSPPPSSLPPVATPPDTDLLEAPEHITPTVEHEPKPSRKRKAPSEAKPATETVPAASDLAEEMRLLKKGQSALAGGKHSRALSAFDEHARRFPDGVLRDERRVRRAEALCGLGRGDQARKAAQAFVSDAPNSPLAGKASRICEEKE